MTVNCEVNIIFDEGEIVAFKLNNGNCAIGIILNAKAEQITALYSFKVSYEVLFFADGQYQREYISEGDIKSSLSKPQFDALYNKYMEFFGHQFDGGIGL